MNKEDVNIKTDMSSPASQSDSDDNYIYWLYIINIDLNDL